MNYRALSKSLLATSIWLVCMIVWVKLVLPVIGETAGPALLGIGALAGVYFTFVATSLLSKPLLAFASKLAFSRPTFAPWARKVHFRSIRLILAAMLVADILLILGAMLGDQERGASQLVVLLPVTIIADIIMFSVLRVVASIGAFAQRKHMPSPPSTSEALPDVEVMTQRWQRHFEAQVLGSDKRRKWRARLVTLARDHPELAAKLFCNLMQNPNKHVTDNLLAIVHELETTPQAYGVLQPFFYSVEAQFANVASPELTARKVVLEQVAIIVQRGVHPVPLVPSLLKRCFDVFVSLLVLILCAPAFVLIYLAIKLETGWRSPAFFVIPRLGQRVRVFHYFQFSTSARGSKGTESELSQVGRFLATIGLERLPAFVNVLLGQMSVVGPAPVYYGSLWRDTHRMALRLVAKPGLVSRAQLAAASTPSDCDTYVEWDLEYVSKLLQGMPVLLEDIKLIGKGIFLVIVNWMVVQPPENALAWVALLNDELI